MLESIYNLGIMDNTDVRYSRYKSILEEELMPAMGCTEPIAIAYAAAKARKVLGVEPERVEIIASNNIIKNVKSVVVPNTNGLKGIPAAAVAGIIAGDSEKILEVISEIGEEEKVLIRDFLQSKEVKVDSSSSDLIFDLTVKLYSGKESSLVQISYYHTNIVKIQKNGEDVIYSQACDEIQSESKTDRSTMTVEGIIDFAESVDLNDVEDLIERQIRCNSAIAEEGLRGDWGANVGSVIMNAWGDKDVKIRAKAMAAAGSDARMSGCELPVMIVSGSGNQGLTASMPVIEFAKELESDRETLIRALVVSNLLTIHQKTGIGRLSAFCGVISAGVAAGAGIAWLHGGRFDEIAHTIVNGLAMTSGIICDGAKPSCAGKIASAVDSGLLGYYMYKQGQQFYGGDGIVVKGVENTIRNVGRLGREGMKETDKEIIRMMLGE